MSVLVQPVAKAFSLAILLERTQERLDRSAVEAQIGSGLRDANTKLDICGNVEFLPCGVGIEFGLAWLLDVQLTRNDLHAFRFTGGKLIFTRIHHAGGDATLFVLETDRFDLAVEVFVDLHETEE